LTVSVFSKLVTNSEGMQRAGVRGHVVTFLSTVTVPACRL